MHSRYWAAATVLAAVAAFSVLNPRASLLGACHAASAIARRVNIGLDWGPQGAPQQRPDGDVELPDVELPDGLPRRPAGDVELQHGMRSFVVPPCSSCGGVLKPNVVFCEGPCFALPMVTCASMGLP